MLVTSGNLLAVLALVAWPLVTIALFLNLRPQLAALVSIIGGYLLLPMKTRFDLPMFPTLDKESLPVVAVILCLATIVPLKHLRSDAVLPSWIPRRWALWLISLAFLGIAITSANNTGALRYGTTVLKGMSLYDALSWSLSTIILILPLIAARRLFGSPESHKLLLKFLCYAGLAYSLLALFEVRMSPQLNVWVYGFFPHSFAQHMRGDGFRPVVFLQHGLWLAIFLSATILAAFATFRLAPVSQRVKFFAAGLWLLATLVLAKSLGALMITLLLAPVVLFLSARVQIIVAAAIALVIVLYPVTRGTSLVPIDRVIAFAESVDPQRAQSLEVRLKNEERMLEKVRPRQLYGWGTWGRWRVYDEAGADITISDGVWVRLFSIGGWIHYIAIYGLLAFPIFLLLRQRTTPIGLETAGIAVILTGQLIDTIPNGTLTPVTWILAGALWGRLEWQGASEPKPEAIGANRPRRAGAETGPRRGRGDAPVYTRQIDLIDRRKGSPN